MFKLTFSTIILGSRQPLELILCVKFFGSVPEPKCQTTPHHIPHKIKNTKHQTTQVPQGCGNYPAKIDKSQASSKLFWVGVGTQTSKKSSATIFNHQGKASGKASHELVFGWISSTHDPNQIKLKSPTSFHTTKKKQNIKQLKCHKFVGTTLPKSTEVRPRANDFFGGVEFQCTFKMLTVEHSCSKKCAKKYPMDRAI